MATSQPSGLRPAEEIPAKLPEAGVLHGRAETPPPNTGDEIHTEQSFSFDGTAVLDTLDAADSRQQYDATQHAKHGPADRFGVDRGEQDNIVCYGMLYKVNCQFLRTLVELDEQSLNGSTEEYAELILKFDKNQIITAINGNAAFAQLNSVATSALNSVAAFSRTSFQAYMSKSERESLFDPRSHHNKALPRFTLNVNILGPILSSDEVGDLLSDQGLFLQEPLAFANHYAYQNPHIWTFQDLLDVDVWLARLAQDKPEQMAAQQSWSHVLDELADTNVEQMDLDLSRVTTQLLNHQLHAVGFMTSREIGKLADSSRYWRSGIDESGTTVYHHTVTAADRRERQCEPVSGILADDMGLGKILSAIALVSTSTDRAEAFTMYTSNRQVSHGFLTPTKATLVIVPSVLILEEWKKEIEKHTTSGSLRVAKYHGHDRVVTFKELLSYDIVLTTYGTVSTEWRRSYRGGREVLYYLQWFRIVLDEAHTIRSARTTQCKAILALSAKHHWCLTGTPVSNRVEDLAPLLRFCRVPLLQEQAVFQEYVAKVTRRSFVQGCNALRQVLSPVCLRRTKALLNLPQPRAIDHEVVFSVTEEDRKNVLLERFRRQLDAAVSGHDRGCTTILQAILQLRIFCNQGTFMSHAQDEDDEEYLDPDEALTLLQEEGRATCASCATEVAIVNQHRDSSSGILGVCSHILCSVCWGALQEDPQPGEKYRCPKCDDVFLQAELSDERVRCKTSGPAAPTSAKLAKLVEELIETQGKDKSIVFSVWRKTLDVTASLCSDARIRHVRIDGTVPQAARQQALKQFTNDPSISTLLMTLGTGALGLNLTAATRVHILEPQWNPAVEKQAVGRVVRIGQEKNATVIRYSVKNSVEQQIQMYQKRKLQLAASGFGDGPNSTEFESKLLRATFFTGGKL